jgi:DNA-binding transcriptional LysR family regulator
MDLWQLETFLAVVEERGFSRAATRLHRTQPAVSQTIRKLEEELGEQLFERTSREGTLTSAGELLRTYAERLLRLRAEAQIAMEELQSLERGRLVIAANEYTCLYLLPVLDEFRRVCPQIGVTVQRSLASRIPEHLLERSVEFGIITFRPDPAQFQATAVYSDGAAFVMSPDHPLARLSEVPIRELGAENFVAHNVASPLRQRIIEIFAVHQTPLNIGVELPSLEAVKRYVGLGNGVALVPTLTVEPELSRGELIHVPIPEIAITRTLWLVQRRGVRLSHAGAAFLRVVERISAERGNPFLYRIEQD